MKYKVIGNESKKYLAVKVRPDNETDILYPSSDNITDNELKKFYQEKEKADEINSLNNEFEKFYLSSDRLFYLWLLLCFSYLDEVQIY